MHHLSKNARNLLIAGIPRGGTTLLTAAIHKLPNCVALGEPIDLRAVKKISVSVDDFAQRVLAYIYDVRGQIVSDLPVPLRFYTGTQEIVTNYNKRVKTDEGHDMEKTYEIRYEICKVENEDFCFGIKHNEMFTAALESLTSLRDTSVFVIIRDPSACLLSWRSLTLPISVGKLPKRLLAPAWFTQKINKIRKVKDLLEKQVRYLDLFFEAYSRSRSKIVIIRYEDFVQNHALLRKYLDIPLDYVFPQYESRNRSPEYNLQELDMIGDYLDKFAQHSKLFYP